MTTKRHRKKIARELPPVGTTLQGKSKGETYTATIVEAEGLPAGRGVRLGEDLYASFSACAPTSRTSGLAGSPTANP